MAVEGFPMLPSKGDVVVVVGNRSLCEPCEKLSEFIEKEGDTIDVEFVEIDILKFNTYFVDARIDGIPKLFFIRDGKVIMTDNGFKGSVLFMAQISGVFGLK